MKNTITLVLLLVTFNFFAQTSGELVIFSNLGEKFFVILNGEKQNQVANGNVKVDALQPGFYSCKVLSENNIFVLDKNFEIKTGLRLTMRVVEAKGVYKLRYFSETALSENQTNTSGQAVVVYQPVSTTTTPITQTQTTTTTQTTTPIPTTVNTGVNSGSESVNININMSETGVSTNVSGIGTEAESNFSQTTTVTTTTSTSATGTTVNHDQHHSGHHDGNNNHSTTHQNQPATTNSNCLVDNAGMTKVIQMIKDESFSDTKMNIAKQFTKGRCLTVAQIKEITQLFSFSEDKMEYVKYAYDYCMNTKDYYQLAEVFTFSDDKDQLNGFINSK